MRIVWDMRPTDARQPPTGFRRPASSSQLGEKPLISMRVVWEMYENCMRNASNWCSPATNRLLAVYFRVFKETQCSSRKGPDQAECNVKSNVPVVFKEPAESLRWHVTPALVRCLAFLMLFFRVVWHDWRFDFLHLSSHSQWYERCSCCFVMFFQEYYEKCMRKLFFVWETAVLLILL